MHYQNIDKHLTLAMLWRWHVYAGMHGALHVYTRTVSFTCLKAFLNSLSVYKKLPHMQLT